MTIIIVTLFEDLVVLFNLKWFFCVQSFEKAMGMTACGSSQTPVTKRHNLPLHSSAHSSYSTSIGFVTACFSI